MTAGIVVTGLIVWSAAPFFLFMHGKAITIPKGTEVPTFINGNFPLEIARFQQGFSSGTPGAQPTASQFRAPTNAAFQRQVGAVAEIEIPSTPSGGEIDLDGVHTVPKSTLTVSL
jgi:hypothetical protein